MRPTIASTVRLSVRERQQKAAHVIERRSASSSSVVTATVPERSIRIDRGEALALERRPALERQARGFLVLRRELREPLSDLGIACEGVGVRTWG